MRPTRILLFLFIAVYFVFFTWSALWNGFAPDDMHNLDKYWVAGPQAVWKANLTFWSSFYRPAGGAWYLAIYSLAHMSPLPYRLGCLLLVALNLWLAFRVCRIVGMDAETASLAVGLSCFHAAMLPIYNSNSTIYDILCFLFYYAAFLWYVKHRPMGGWQMAVFLLLYVAALNAKEMAVTLPLFVLLWELAHGRRGIRDLAPALAAGLLTLVYIYGKMTGPDSLSDMAAYHPTITLHAFLATARNHMKLMFYTDRFFSTAKVLGLWVLMPLAAWLLRSRILALLAAFAILSFLPVAFLPPREGFVMYMPLLWWSAYAALLLMELRRRYAERVPAWTLAILIPLAIAPVHWSHAEHDRPFLLHALERTNGALDGFRALSVPVARGSCLLIRDSPFGQDWDAYFMAKLWFNDHALRVALQDGSDAPRGDTCESYDRVLEFRDGTLTVLK
ncbi:MAG: hypothetical protein ABI823_06495 [Bryobacteraceae bacterium]